MATCQSKDGFPEINWDIALYNNQYFKYSRIRFMQITSWVKLRIIKKIWQKTV